MTHEVSTFYVDGRTPFLEGETPLLFARRMVEDQIRDDVLNWSVCHVSYEQEFIDSYHLGELIAPLPAIGRWRIDAWIDVDREAFND